jgi:Na+/melibiose symporter-like transporter
LGGTGVAYVGIALISVMMAPYLMAVAGVPERPYAFTALHALIPAGALLGSLIAGLLPGLWANWLGLSLDQPAPYRWALWLGPILLGLSLLPLLRADPAPVAQASTRPGDAAQEAETLAKTEATQAGVRLPLGRLVWFGTVVLFSAIALNTVRTFFNVYLDQGLGASAATIGAVMGVGQLLPLVVVFSVPWLLQRWGSGSTLLGGLLGMALTLLPLALVPLLGAAAVTYMAFQAVIAVTNPARDLFGQELVQARWRTTSQGIATLGAALGAVAAGVGGGLLVERLGFSALYTAGALATLLAAGLLLSYLRRGEVRSTLPESEPAVKAAP